MALRYVQELNWLYDNSDDKLRVSCFVDSVFGLTEDIYARENMT